MGLNAGADFCSYLEDEQVCVLSWSPIAAMVVQHYYRKCVEVVCASYRISMHILFAVEIHKIGFFSYRPICLYTIKYLSFKRQQL